MKTNWSRCSSALLVVLAVIAAVAVAATPAAAVSVGTEDVPEEAAVGSKVDAAVTLEEPYKNPQLEQWTLTGETELTGVTWTVTYYDQTGAKVNQQSFDGQSLDGAKLAASKGVSEVEVRVSGTVPEVEEYTYDPAPTFAVMNLTQAREGGSSNDIGSWSARHYTEKSQAARDAIVAARDAIDSAGGANTGEAEKTLGNAIDAYEGENPDFALATNLANDAEKQASRARQSKQTTQYAMYGVGGLVALGVLAGGVFWWRSQRDSYDRLG